MVVDRRFAAFAVSRIVLFRTGRAMALAVSHIDCDSAMAVFRRRENGSRPSGDGHATVSATARGMESNKGVSEGLSALAGKSIRVRHESPSKTPKNGF